MGNGGAAGWLTAGLLVAAGVAQAECRDDQIELRSPAGAMARFSVEVADDEGERAQGLMFRDRLPAGAGMLFVYPKPGPVAFWMKNTLIPLDLVFADASGTVVKVHANAAPKDLTAIPGGSAVQFVLEINGGLAASLGIGPGTVMRHPAISAGGGAAWACD
jgi:uncharacterized membrane protein (UPF0127 family)